MACGEVGLFLSNHVVLKELVEGRAPLTGDTDPTLSLVLQLGEPVIVDGVGDLGSLRAPRFADLGLRGVDPNRRLVLASLATGPQVGHGRAVSDVRAAVAGAALLTFRKAVTRALRCSGQFSDGGSQDQKAVRPVTAIT